MSLDLTSLKIAVPALERSVQTITDSYFMDGLTDDQAATIRAGVINRYNITYELCWKFIQRWLKENQTAGEVDLPHTRKDLFRIAAQQGLIDDPEPWFIFGNARNITAHTYDADNAQLVCETAIQFVDYAKSLLARLETLND